MIIINQSDQPSFEGAGQPEELAKDVLEIIAVFSTRLYSRKNQQLMEKLTQVVEDTGQP